MTPLSPTPSRSLDAEPVLFNGTVRDWLRAVRFAYAVELVYRPLDVLEPHREWMRTFLRPVSESARDYQRIVDAHAWHLAGRSPEAP